MICKDMEGVIYDKDTIRLPRHSTNIGAEALCIKGFEGREV